MMATVVPAEDGRRPAKAEPTRSLKSLSTEELVEKYAPLIKLVASRIIRRLPPQIELGDLINSGVLGLMDAIEKFDEGRDIKFETYAEFRIRGAILDELRSLDWVPRSIRQKIHELERTLDSLESKHQRPATDDETAKEMRLGLEEYYDLLNQANGVTLISFEDLGFTTDGNTRRNALEYLRDTKEESLLGVLHVKEIKALVVQAIDALPEKEKLVVAMYYYDELTMKEIGMVLGITESRVSQIHNKAVLRLRGKLKRFFKEE
jgi:RNA polymerase sigma factor for flagellar operon FliA